MSQEQTLRVGWGAHAARLVLIVLWLAVSPALAGAATSEGFPVAGRAVAAGLIAAPAIGWVAMLGWRRTRVDEFNASILTTALYSGAVFALLFGPLTLALNVLAEVDDGMRDRIEHMALGLLSCQVPMAAFIGEMAAQRARRRFAHEGAA